MLERLGARVGQYYDALLCLTCTEVVKQQALGEDLAPAGPPREFVYDLLITRGAVTDAGAAVPFIANRKLKFIDGKPVADKPLSKCLTPAAAFNEPLSFLLPENQPAYLFTYAGQAELQGAEVYVLTFTPKQTEVPAVNWQGDCFSLHTQYDGRLWIEPGTYDVLQLELRLHAPYEFKPRGAAPLFHRLRGARPLRYEKDETLIRFGLVYFPKLKQTVRLPVSAESLTIIKGARVPRFRTTRLVTDCKRFVTEVIVHENNGATVPHP